MIYLGAIVREIATKEVRNYAYYFVRVKMLSHGLFTGNDLQGAN